MSALSIQPTFPIFTGTDGLPLENGYIWIGAANLDPQGNPISVYWDAALTIPAGQPIRTLNGYPSRSGTPARLYVNSNYSIRVQDSKGSLVYSAPEATEQYSSILVNFIQSGVGAVVRTAQDKMRDVVSLKDFIPPGIDPAITDVHTYLQAALDAHAAVYIPQGTYCIGGPVDIGAGATLGNKTIFGDGNRNTILKATHSTACLRNENTHYWIQLSDFSFRGEGIATTGISLGVPGLSLPVSALDTLERINVSGCVSHGIKMENTQYQNIIECTVNNIATGHGLYLNRFNSGIIFNCHIIENEVGMFLGGTNVSSTQSSAIVTIQNCDFYGPYGTTVPNGYLDMDNVSKVYITECKFENERVFSQPLVKLSGTNVGTVTTDIYFTKCIWIGLPYANDLIRLIDGQRVFFNLCNAIRPSAGNYIINSSIPAFNDVVLTDCFAATGYTTYPTLYWTEAGFSTGDFYEYRSAQTITHLDYANNRLGVNNTTPAFSFDQGNPTGTTGIISRQYGGTYTQREFAPNFQVRVQTTTSNANRGLQVNLNGSTINLYAVGGASPDTYSPVGDGVIDIGYDTSLVTTGRLAPRTDNTYDLGTAPLRWKEVFAVAPAINTSDATEKQQIRELSESERLVAIKLKTMIRAFKWNDAVALKGDGARWHFGVMAQDVQTVFAEQGLDASQYGAFCSDTWYEYNGNPVPVNADKKFVDSYWVDADGNRGDHVSGHPTPEGCTDVVDIHDTVKRTRLGVRYEELMAFIISAI
jgi:hypothetical protein